VQVRLDLRKRTRHAVLISSFRRGHQALEDAAGGLRRTPAALACIGVRQGREVTACAGGCARSTGGEPPGAGVADRLHRRAKPRLVGVEEVGPRRGHRRRSRHPPFAEGADGERGIGTRTREPGWRAELAHEQPGTGRIEVAAFQGAEGSVGGDAEHSRPGLGPCDLERDSIVCPHGRSGGVEAASDLWVTG
jgi:hypothetical protein